MDVKRRINWRILVFGFIVTMLFTGMTVRLWWIQSADAAWVLEDAKKKWEKDKVIKPKRGSILDRNLQVLAYEGKAYTVNATLKPRNEKEKKSAGENYVKDPFYTASKLSPILNVPVDQLLKPLTRTDAFIVELGKGGKKITEEQKNQILALQYPKNEKGEASEVNQLPGVTLWDTNRRFYPLNSFASHVVGFLSYEDKPGQGIEQTFDKVLRGEPGFLQVMNDGAGYQLPDGEQAYKPAKDGLNVVTTIDQQIQEYVEQALDQAQREYKPKTMMAIVADPNTGEILGMANRPQFNPNTYWDINSYEDQKNNAISYNFEPGSTFKIITLAAAIDQGLFNPNEFYQSGTYKMKNDKPIRDHNGGAGWGKISFLEGVQRSSNVAFVILGYERLKQELLSKYFERFGVGKETKIDLPGEEAGIMRDLKKPLSQRNVAVTTFGQGVAVTAIQQVAAVGAIANGGELLKPHIVKEFRDPHSNQVVKKFGREVVRRVVSKETAKQTRDYLETVVSSEKGTGRYFGEGLEGYHIAGKTGTAQKYDPKTSEIMPGKYIYSFIGFAPKDNPRLLVYVVVDEPETEYDSSVVGRYIVAPIFKSIMERSMQYVDHKPDVQQPQALRMTAPVYEKIMPNLIGMGTSTAEIRAKQDGFQVTTIGTGTKIVQQYPAAQEKVVPQGQVYLVTEKVKGTVMPDFKGKSLREVMEFASIVNLPVVPVGNGFVRDQNIKAGTILSGTEKLQVTLQPVSAPAATAATRDQTVNPASAVSGNSSSPGHATPGTATLPDNSASSSGSAAASSGSAVTATDTAVNPGG